jgi:hypothetical protein
MSNILNILATVTLAGGSIATLMHLTWHVAMLNLNPGVADYINPPPNPLVMFCTLHPLMATSPMFRPYIKPPYMPACR